MFYVIFTSNRDGIAAQALSHRSAIVGQYNHLRAPTANPSAETIRRPRPSGPGGARLAGMDRDAIGALGDMLAAPSRISIATCDHKIVYQSASSVICTGATPAFIIPSRRAARSVRSITCRPNGIQSLTLTMTERLLLGMVTRNIVPPGQTCDAAVIASSSMGSPVHVRL
jgi:hypothetical protein